MTDRILRFERFELRTAQRCLLRDGREVALRSRAFDLLVALVERAGRVVTKNELLEVVWPGLVVEENNVAAQVASLRKALAGELIVTVPGRGYRFAAEPSSTDAAAMVVLRPPAPPGASQRLFGRVEDLACTRAALALPGCVTLVGPGGVGKTSLAREIVDGPVPWPGATGAAIAPPALWIDAAALSRESDVAAALARAAGIEAGAEPMLATVVERWPRNIARLVVIDNAEHLISAVAAAAAALVDGTSALRVLVTSQMPLRIRAERVERLEPLALPDPALSDELALGTDAVALFVDRVLAADSRWQFAPGSIGLLRQLCTALDGLPLALEMAASRVPLLGLQRVHDELANRFGMLRRGRRDAPTRHASLLAALEWGHELLSDSERLLYRRLGVFVGGFTPDLAIDAATEATPDMRWDEIDRLGGLVDRSLVATDHRDPPRYRLLETMRHHALEKLRIAGEEHAARDHHLEAMLRLTARVLADPSSPELRRAALDEMDNARAAFEHGLQHAPACAVTLATDCCAFVTFASWRSEVLRWMGACEPHVGAIEPRARARWRRQYATQLLFASDGRAFDVARLAVDECREHEDDLGRFWALIPLTRAWPPERIADPELQMRLDELQALVRHHPEWAATTRGVAHGTLALTHGQRDQWEAALLNRLAELECAREAGRPQNIGAAETNVAFTLHSLGRNAEALERLDDFLAAHPNEDSSNVLYARCMRVRALLGLDRVAEALAETRPALAMCRRYQLAEIEDLAALAVLRIGRPRAAAALYGHALAVYAERDIRIATKGRGLCATLGQDLEEALGVAPCARWVAAGRQLDEARIDRLLDGNCDIEDLSEFDA